MNMNVLLSGDCQVNIGDITISLLATLIVVKLILYHNNEKISTGKCVHTIILHSKHSLAVT